MLTIYTSKDSIPRDSKKSIAYNIEARFKLKLADAEKQYTDADSVLILKDIEGMTRRDGEVIHAKFGAVSIQNISTGAKGCLLASTYNKEMIVSTDELGYNCIFILFEIAKHKDIEVISSRPYGYVPNNSEALIDGTLLSNEDICDYMENIYD